MSQPLARRVPDACAALGIGITTLYKLASEGKITLIRIAGRTLVPESEIVRLASPSQSPSQSPSKSWIEAKEGEQARTDRGKHAKIIKGVRMMANGGER